MSHLVRQTSLIAQFKCLGDACEDTCCQNWSMQLDDQTFARYKKDAPELLDAVALEPDGLRVMKRDATTQRCVKFEDGWCGVHKEYGDTMLGDACHFYPRITRKCSGNTVMTATASCPEIARLMLSLEAPFSYVDANIERLPNHLKSYGNDTNDLLVHQSFMDVACDDTLTAEASLARISSVARSMELLDQTQWHQSIPLYLRLASGRLPTADPKINDPHNLLHALCGLIVASHKNISPRLKGIISDMERSLAATLDWQQVTIHLKENGMEALNALKNHWNEHRGHYEHALKRYLQLQLSAGLFPFGGLGNTPAERISIIGVRFSTVKLALASAGVTSQNALADEDVIRIIQSISRFQDHLGDAVFSLQIYEETGWLNEARLLGLIGF